MQSTWLTLDRDHRILSAVGHYAPVHQEMGSIGKVVWEMFPDSEPQFRPVYERAWRDGFAYELIPFRGLMVEAHANVACDDRLVVCLKSWTLEGLRDALASLEQATGRPRKRRLRLVS